MNILKQRKMRRNYFQITFIILALSIIAINVYSYTQSIPDPGHGGDTILVSLDGSEMTLQAAIDGQCLCGHSPNPYIGSINPGHYASEIQVTTSSEVDLQSAIDSEYFCGSLSGYCDGKECGSDTCGGYCPPEYNDCGSGYHCDNGQCVVDCTNDCSTRYQWKCESGNEYRCNYCAGGDSCLDWCPTDGTQCSYGCDCTGLDCRCCTYSGGTGKWQNTGFWDNSHAVAVAECNSIDTCDSCEDPCGGDVNEGCNVNCGSCNGEIGSACVLTDSGDRDWVYKCTSPVS